MLTFRVEHKIAGEFRVQAETITDAAALVLPRIDGRKGVHARRRHPEGGWFDIYIRVNRTGDSFSSTGYPFHITQL